MADEKKQDGALSGLVQAESMVQLGLALPLGCLVGWFLGSLGDKHFHTKWMMVAGIVMGAVGGFLQIWRVASGYLKRGDQ